jgi:hypothetical protein
MKNQRVAAAALACGVLGATLSTSALADDKKYTMADLEALVQQKSFKEAYLHLGDIAPSARNAKWVDVGAAAAGGFLGQIEGEGAAIAIIDEIDREYPQLVKNAKYAKPRAEEGYKALEQCFGNSYGIEHCVKVAMRFADNGSDKALTLKVAKLARRSMNAYGAVPFFEKAVAADKAACKDEDAKLAVIAGLGLPADYDNAKKAKVLATTCFADIKADILKAFEADSEGGYTQRASCELLTKNKMISASQQKGCSKKS